MNNKPVDKKDAEKKPAGNDNKAAKGGKNKLIVIIVCAAAVLVAAGLILWLTLGRPGGTDVGPDPTDSQSGDVSASDGSDTAGNDPTKTTDRTPDGTTAPTDPDVSGKTPDTTAPNVPIDPDDPNDPDDPGDIDEPGEYTEPEIFVTEGPASNGEVWPGDKLPDGIPEFKNIIKIYNCTYQKEDDGSEAWFMSWDAAESDYDAWLDKLEAAGFYKSVSIVGFYGNGSVILDIATEDGDDDVVWVSVDIYRAEKAEMPASIAGVYPMIETTATVYYCVDTDDGFEIHYQCAKDWEEDLNGYIEKLYAEGFELSYNKGTKTVDGKKYTVSWGADVKDRETITYTYGE